MTGNIVARRYAKALFSLGKKQGGGEAAAYGKDLENLAAALEASPAVVKVFANPVFSVEEKKSVLKELGGKLGLKPMVANFLGLLADKGRLDQLGAISQFYNVLLDADLGVLRGECVTAIALADARRDDIKAKLEKQAGKKVILSFGVDPSILGGVKLKIGDKVLDASLRAQLQILKDQIKRGD